MKPTTVADHCPQVMSKFESMMEGGFGDRWRDLPNEQLIELRRAFFGGLSAALYLLEDGCTSLELKREIDRFVVLLRSGRA